MASCGIISGKSSLERGLGLGPVDGLLRAIAALIGDDEFDVAAPTQRPIAPQTAEGRQVVRLLAEAMLVEMR